MHANITAAIETTDALVLPAEFVLQDGVLVAKPKKKGFGSLATFATGIVYGLQVRWCGVVWAFCAGHRGALEP